MALSGTIKSLSRALQGLPSFPNNATRYIRHLALVLLASAVLMGWGHQAPAPGCQLVQRAAEIYLRITKPGITRREIEQYFKEDGGVQFPAPVRYVYKECNLIKVEITFNRAQSGNSMDDTVNHASKLYIEFPVMD